MTVREPTSLSEKYSKLPLLIVILQWQKLPQVQAQSLKVFRLMFHWSELHNENHETGRLQQVHYTMK